jgi:hypothetical protein
MKCGVTKKVIFKSYNSAIVRITQILSDESNKDYTPRQFRAYKCEYCGKYHLTSKEI